MQDRASQVNPMSLGRNLFELINDSKWDAARWCIEKSNEAPDELRIKYSQKNNDDISYLIACLKQRDGVSFVKHTLLPLLLDDVANRTRILQCNLFDYDERGMNCFHLLAEMGESELFFDLVAILKQYFPKVSPAWIDVDHHERTPLHVAASFNRIEFAKKYLMLDEVKLIINAYDHKLNTAIHLTTHGCMIALLIKHGASIAIPNNQNKTLISRWFNDEIFEKKFVFNHLDKEAKNYFFCWAREYCRKNPSEDNKDSLLDIAILCSLQAYLLSKCEFGLRKVLIPENDDLISTRYQNERGFIRDLERSQKLMNALDIYHQELLIRHDQKKITLKNRQRIKKIILAFLIVLLYSSVLGFLSAKADSYHDCGRSGDCRRKSSQYFLATLLFGLLGSMVMIGAIAIVFSRNLFAKLDGDPILIADDQRLDNIRGKLKKNWIAPLAQVPDDEQFISDDVIRELQDMYTVLSDPGLTDTTFNAGKPLMIRSLKTFKSELYASGRSITLFRCDEEASLEEEIIDISDDENSVLLPLISKSSIV